MTIEEARKLLKQHLRCTPGVIYIWTDGGVIRVTGRPLASQAVPTVWHGYSVEWRPIQSDSPARVVILTHEEWAALQAIRWRIDSADRPAEAVLVEPYAAEQFRRKTGRSISEVQFPEDFQFKRPWMMHREIMEGWLFRAPDDGVPEDDYVGRDHVEALLRAAGLDAYGNPLP